MFPTEPCSIQASQQIRSIDDISVSINTIKCFLGKKAKNIVSRRNKTTTKGFQSLQKQL